MAPVSKSRPAMVEELVQKMCSSLDHMDESVSADEVTSAAFTFTLRVMQSNISLGCDANVMRDAVTQLWALLPEVKPSA
jgi:hypothetical protein